MPVFRPDFFARQRQPFVSSKTAAGTAKVIVCHGNSETTAPGGGLEYPAVLAGLRPTDTIYNEGVGGIGTRTMTTNFTSAVHAHYDGAKDNWVIALEVVDSIDDEAQTAIQEYANWVDYCKTAHALGWKVVVCTAPDIIEPVAQAQDDAWRAIRLDFSNRLRADHSFANRFIDYLARSEFQNPNDTTYYNADKIHVNAAGANLLATLANAALNEADALSDSPLAIGNGRIARNTMLRL